MRVLVVNAGSSSLKLSVLSGDRRTAERLLERWDGEGVQEAVRDLLEHAGPVDAVAHRVVHGGPDRAGPVRVDEEVIDELDAIGYLAPLHQPRAIAGLRSLAALLPEVPAVACFDTAFHHGLPAAAATYALPAQWNARWRLRRYGFHGLSHAYGAAFDNPDLVVACVVGDGEAETGPLAASWHSNKFVDATRDGAVLPILHLNGYKIASPTVLARIPEQELVRLLQGYGHRPILVGGEDPAQVHRALTAALDDAFEQIAAIQARARNGEQVERPAWPLIVLRTPKGWTGPAVVDGAAVEGTWRAHQVPLSAVRTNAEHLAQLEQWMRSYRPEELFTSDGALRADLAALAPHGEQRMSANPHANGGALLQPLRLPDFRDYAVDVPRPAAGVSEATRVTGTFLRDVVRANPRTFRVMGPDETASNRLSALFEATDRSWDAAVLPGDDHLAADGRVMEVLSEHLCRGWLEGYLLTGRHGLFNCYEAFIHIIDSMVNQHAKWLKTTREIPWRRPIASLNYLLSSHVWRQDHNGFSHQDPGFIDHMVNKKAEIVGSTCRRTPTRCCRRSTTAYAAATTSTSWSPASSPLWTTCRSRRPSCTARADSGSGSGPATTKVNCPTS